ncbi:hypothetical protein CRUP_024381, partial [Coryphaenoides rupestris]
MESDERELLHLLNTPHLKAVLSAHDTVAQKNFDPVLPPLPEDLEEDLEEESVKIVRLVKNKEPLEEEVLVMVGVGVQLRCQQSQRLMEACRGAEPTTVMLQL